MVDLKLRQWTSLFLFAHVKIVTSRNITVLVHFGSGDVPASVLAADDIATTYEASTPG